MEAQIETVNGVRKFDSNNIQMYIDELMGWMLVMQVENKQGLMVWMSLPKNEPSNIKQFINNSIRIEDLHKDDGIKKIIAVLKKAFQEEAEIDVH